MTDAELRSLEHRGERPYDEQDPSTIIHPNGTIMRCSHRTLNGYLMLEVLKIHGVIPR